MKTDIEKILEGVGKRVFPHTGYTILNGEPRNPNDIPNNLNVIRELELMVIEKVGAERYGYNLNLIVNCDPSDNVLATPNEELAFIATVDASTRIAAMLAALEGE